VSPLPAMVTKLQDVIDIVAFCKTNQNEKYTTYIKAR
jgi:hypothetical protein